MSAGELAWRLAEHLALRGVEARVLQCEEIVLVWVVRLGLNVWCEWSGEEWRFRWSLDAPTEPGRWRYTSCPCSSMETAARRIAGLFQRRLGVEGNTMKTTAVLGAMAAPEGAVSETGPVR